MARAGTGSVRLNPDGSIDADTGFNANLPASFNGAIRAMAVGPDNRVLIGGDFTTVTGGNGQDRIARLNADGTLDTGFQNGANDGANAFVEDIAIQTDGRIMVAGGFTLQWHFRRRVVRLTAAGATDPQVNYERAQMASSTASRCRPTDRSFSRAPSRTSTAWPATASVRLNGGQNTDAGAIAFGASNFNVAESQSTVSLN